jgi:CHRD domain-containing protein
MNKHLIGTGLVIAIVTLGVIVAVASDDDRRGPNRVRATLSGYEETPSTLSTAGHGKFKAVIDDRAMTIEYELSFDDLEGGAALAAHIHLGQRATSGGVSAFLCGGGTKPPCPPAGGTVTGTIVPSDVIGPTAQGIAPGEFDELVRAIRAGFTYANVHSTARPGGEIRGQIQARDNHDDR